MPVHFCVKIDAVEAEVGGIQSLLSVGTVADHAHQLGGLLHLELLEQHKLGVWLLCPCVDLNGVVLGGNHEELHLLMLNCIMQVLPWKPLYTQVIGDIKLTNFKVNTLF